MSVFSCTSPQHILNSPHNNSPSKFHFTIPKQIRFPRQSGYCQQAHYGHKSQLSSVGSKVGTGHRSDFTKTTSVAPASTLYVVPTKFETNVEKNVGQTFGLSRDTLKQFGHVTQPIQSNPGVGQYSMLNQKSKLSYSMRPKTSNLWLPSFLREKCDQEAPGPAYYFDSSMDQSKLGLSINAKYKSVISSSISRSRRFRTSSFRTPGPCQYTNPDPLNDSGAYKISWYKGAGKRLMSRGKRDSFIDTATKDSYGPGPGQYRQPSEFGHYDYMDITNSSFYRSMQRPKTTTNGSNMRPQTN